MVQVVARQSFPVPAGVLWDMIGAFGDTGRWTGRPPEACRHEGSGIGSLRTLTLADGREIVDRLVAEGAMSYSYEIVSSPLPVAAYRATMAVAPAGEGECLFTWSGDITPAGISDEAAASLFEGVYAQGIGMIEAQLARRGLGQ